MSGTQLEILHPSASDARSARRSMRALEGVFQRALAQREHGTVDLEGVEIPAAAARALMTIIHEMAAGRAVAVHPLDSAEVSTSQAAQLVGVSRPTLIDLLDREGVQYRMAGTHRRIPLSEVFALKASLERNASPQSESSREAKLRRLRDMAEYSDELGFGY